MQMNDIGISPTPRLLIGSQPHDIACPVPIPHHIFIYKSFRLVTMMDTRLLILVLAIIDLSDQELSIALKEFLSLDRTII